MKFNRIGVLFVAVVLASAANAAPTLQVKGGNATLVLAPDFISSLGSCFVARIKPATYNFRKARASFTVGGGVLDSGTLSGEFQLRGGLHFACPDSGKYVSVHNMLISSSALSTDPAAATSTTGSPKVSGAIAVNDTLTRRIELFDISENLQISPANKKSATVQNAVFQLTQDGANLLNSELQTTAFSAGQEVGTADANIRLYNTPKKDVLGNSAGN